MNAVEIEQAVSDLAAQPFDPAEFPFAFLQAFGNRETTLKKLRAGASNKSDIGGVLQTNNIHIAVAQPGRVSETLRTLRDSPATTKAKAKFILATDGVMLEAEDLVGHEVLACEFADVPNRFGFFLPLAGISTVKQIRDNTVDIRATSRLNKLYVELLRENPAWGDAARRHDMNHFMARLIFCFFAESTDIFNGEGLFTSTAAQMGAHDGSDLHAVIGEMFRAMNTAIPDRAGSGLRPWADAFPYVNGGLFSGSLDVPRFSKIARSYLLNIGGLDWKQINPDIFGSMIQAVADDEERGALGLHYTSVPNILKVLNPLFLDELRERLSDAGENRRKLLNLRNRMARIRIFDPACGSGNFLVIAYKEMRAIEAEINARRSETQRRTDIPLTNFRGIEIRDFPAEIARLALIIAEYQCDVIHRGQKEALRDFLPLDAENWIVRDNALRLDWLLIYPPTGLATTDERELFQNASDHDEVRTQELFICSNPPYSGSVNQTEQQKGDLREVFRGVSEGWKSLDYVTGWLWKAALLSRAQSVKAAFVSTKSICQGEQVPIIWPLIFNQGVEISFARRAFKWVNLATHNAAVTVVVVGLTSAGQGTRRLFDEMETGEIIVSSVDNISPYLTSGSKMVVRPTSDPGSIKARMVRGNLANDGGNLILSREQANEMWRRFECSRRFLRRYIGSKEFISGDHKYCVWIEDQFVNDARECLPLSERMSRVRQSRLKGGLQARESADSPHRFAFISRKDAAGIVVPRVSSENRPYLPVGLSEEDVVISERNFIIYGFQLWNVALVASRLHWVWIAAVCVRMRTDFSYSNTLGWNTFAVPSLTEEHKLELTRCAEAILLTREAHFPASIADLYDPDAMPADLRAAHERNDDTLERIYIGRRFRNDTERLEHLFDRYTKMIAAEPANPKRTPVNRRARV